MNSYVLNGNILKKLVLILYVAYFVIWIGFVAIDVTAQTSAKEEILKLREKTDVLSEQQIKSMEIISNLQAQIGYQQALGLDKRLTRLEDILKLQVGIISLIGFDRFFQLLKFLYDIKKNGKTKIVSEGE